jgi:hypothetical protein
VGYGGRLPSFCIGPKPPIYTSVQTLENSRKTCHFVPFFHPPGMTVGPKAQLDKLFS